MKRIALISLHTPTATNCRAASALPFHLLAFRPEGVEVEVWTYNLNGCSPEQIAQSERKLGVRVHLIEKPRRFRLLGLAPMRLLLPRPMLSYLPLKGAALLEIKSFLAGGQACLWIYGEDIAHVAKKFPGVPTVITTPDCEAMYYHRVLGLKGIPLSSKALLRYGLMYHRYAKCTASYPATENITYHLVGRADTEFFRSLNPRANAVFIRHPHYDVMEADAVQIAAGEAIRLLIAGRYDFCMSRAVDSAIEAMLSLPDQVKGRYEVTFLGKDWEQSCHALLRAGFNATIKTFVNDYAAEVSSHHIQLTPVAVGTGTKGKVLDAFANGLCVIGTPLALENIAVTTGIECIEYSDRGELTQWLIKLAQEPALIARIAAAGRAKVLTEHGRLKVANQFFSLFK